MLGDWSEVEGPSAPRPDAHAPLLMRDDTGAALGWRLWNVGDGVGKAPTLVSPVRPTPWPRGVLTSSCTTCGNRPTAGCTCGIYAHMSPEDVVLSWREHTEMVAGKVRAWGTVIRHTDGFRAQHVQIDTLYVPSSIAEVGDELGRAYDCNIGPWRGGQLALVCSEDARLQVSLAQSTKPSLNWPSSLGAADVLSPTANESIVG